MSDMPPLGDPPPPPEIPAPPLRRLEDEPNHMGGLGYFEKKVGQTDNVGMFAFTGAQWIDNLPGITPDDRCDIGSWGPVTFHGPTVGTDIETCSCGRVDAGNEWVDALCSGRYVPHMQNKCSLQVIPVPPEGFIWYIEYRDSEMEAEFLQCHWNHNARTLQELLKLMFEWRDAHVLLGVNDAIALTADAVLTGLDVPESVEEWVRENVPDQFVMRFLNGDTSARERLLPVPDLPDEVSQWLWYKVINAPASLLSFVAGGPSVTTSENLLRHRIATDPAISAEVHEGSFVDDQPGYQLIFRYDYLNGYRSISVKDPEVLRDLAEQIKRILAT